MEQQRMRGMWLGILCDFLGLGVAGKNCSDRFVLDVISNQTEAGTPPREGEPGSRYGFSASEWVLRYSSFLCLSNIFLAPIFFFFKSGPRNLPDCDVLQIRRGVLLATRWSQPWLAEGQYRRPGVPDQKKILSFAPWAARSLWPNFFDAIKPWLLAPLDLEQFYVKSVAETICSTKLSDHSQEPVQQQWPDWQLAARQQFCASMADHVTPKAAVIQFKLQ